ncbi:MAG: hypothetical protein V4504_00535 [Patescibacteria group bacterium]
MNISKAFLTDLRDLKSFNLTADFKLVEKFVKTLRNREKRKSLGIEVIDMNPRALKNKGRVHIVCLGDTHKRVEEYVKKYFQPITDASYSP